MCVDEGRSWDHTGTYSSVENFGSYSGDMGNGDMSDSKQTIDITWFIFKRSFPASMGID